MPRGGLRGCDGALSRVLEEGPGKAWWEGRHRRGLPCRAERVRRQDSIRSEKEPGEEAQRLREVAGAGEGVRGQVPPQGL